MNINLAVTRRYSKQHATALTPRLEQDLGSDRGAGRIPVAFILWTPPQEMGCSFPPHRRKLLLMLKENDSDSGLRAAITTGLDDNLLHIAEDD